MDDASTEIWTPADTLWIEGGSNRDTYVGFRGRIAATGKLSIRILCPCPFLLYWDGQWVGEGPTRWPKGTPEFQTYEVEAGSGGNLVAVYAHCEGVDTRMMESISPFLACEAFQNGQPVATDWRAIELPGYAREVRRINPEFGWMLWSDSRRQLKGWHTTDFDDSQWKPAKAVSNSLPAARPTLSLPKPIAEKIVATEHGIFTERLGYESDDPPARFFLRDLKAHHGAPQGVWRRYDLGKVRLGRAAITLDLPEGAAVEVAHSEALVEPEMRVNPWITLSGGMSCSLNHHIAGGGVETFMGHSPKGGRYLEVHVIGDPRKIRFVSEQFYERTYHGKPRGSFICSDHRLNEIWTAGAETLRSCSEDSVIDNPTRERGEWIGDSQTVGLENGAVAFSDLELFRRGIRHAAMCARGDGLVAGLCPGTVSYLSTYACHWIGANLRFWEMTGDRQFLQEMFPAAKRNMAAFHRTLGPNGLSGDLGWAFIDWGYVGSSGPSETGLNLIYVRALRSMIRWCEALGEDASEHRTSLAKIEAIAKAYIARANWTEIGLQRSVLALQAGMVPEDKIRGAIEFIKRHYLSCFPNDPMAPSLSDPGTAQPRLITPFFSHFALAALWEHAEGDFALDQYRSCWGWALDQGLTTWPEVFDLRWSHCHQWSGCPTWQLSRYVLGLWPRQDLGPNTFEFKPQKCSLASAKGIVPVSGTDRSVAVSFERRGGDRRWQFDAPFAMRLKIGNEMKEFTGRFEHSVGA